MHSLDAVRTSDPAKTALVLAQSPLLVARSVSELRRQGYEIRYHRMAVDALAQFGEAMPQIAVIGPVAQSAALDLLMEDLDLYGVPVIPASRHSVERSPPHMVH